MVADVEANWKRANGEVRHGFAHSLFSEIVFDLDSQQITGFKLKPWAEPFLQVRAGILERTALLPEGSSVQAVRWLSPQDAESLVLQCRQRNPSTRQKVARNRLSRAERNTEIVRRYQAGESTSALAHESGVSERRIRHIIERNG